MIKAMYSKFKKNISYEEISILPPVTSIIYPIHKMSHGLSGLWIRDVRILYDVSVVAYITSVII